MLRITIVGDEIFNDDTLEFSSVNDVVLEMEHSLLSLSKWESEYQKPFLASGPKTTEEVYGYLKAMVVTPGGDLDALYRCTQQTIDEIQTYIDSPRSATTFGVMPERRGPSEVITSELIYFWMASFNIPFECESWHLNRLFALIRICNIKNSKPQKRSKNEIAQERARLNAERRQKLGTTG